MQVQQTSKASSNGGKGQSAAKKRGMKRKLNQNTSETEDEIKLDCCKVPELIQSTVCAWIKRTDGYVKCGTKCLTNRTVRP